MAKTVRIAPLAEITLRKYEKPTRGTDRDHIKKLCLSLGLLQPGDSRDVIVDILLYLHQNKKTKKVVSADDIQQTVVDMRRKQKLPIYGIAPSNVRRQIKRLKDLYLVEKVGDGYRIKDFESFDILFERHVEQYYLKSILDRIKEYCEKL